MVSPRRADLLPRWPLLSSVLLCSLTSCTEPAEEPVVAGRSEPIVAGTTEYGHEAVGAIGTDNGVTFNNSCTGTLIATRWVLTAAHCLVHDGSVISTAGIGFFIGTDSTDRSSGTVISTEAFHVHEHYDPGDPGAGTLPIHDIALIELSADASPTPLEINTLPMTDAAGDPMTWIGFGVSTPPSGGSGVKRLGEGHLFELGWWHLVYHFEGQLPCTGDSGGPALMNLGGGERIVGIISTADDGCDEGGSSVRVDGYVPWIEATMAGTSPGDCRLTGGDCGNLACVVLEDGGTRCMPSDDGAEGEACSRDTATWTTGLPCGDGLACVGSSADPSSGECLPYCQVGDCPAGDRCRLAWLPEVADTGFCVFDCNLLGGDCGPGTACLPSPEGGGYCYASEGLGAGETCDPRMDAWITTPCADGMICAPSGLSGRCVFMCFEDADCDGGAECDVPLFTNVDDLGSCTPCRDDDRDGACREIDCDDTDERAFPGNPEICDDRVDNDCDGAIDTTDDDCTEPDGGPDGDADADVDTDADADGDADGDGDIDADGDGDIDADADAVTEADAESVDTPLDSDGCACAIAGRGTSAASPLSQLAAVLGLVTG